jgi:non-heme chloroperoxidase
MGVVDAWATRVLRGTAVLGAAAAAASAGAVAARLAERAWRSTADPDGEGGLTLPEGDARTVRTDDGAELAVTIAGPSAGSRKRLGKRRAPTVVLAHCWACDSHTWAPVARRLVESGHRVVLYDQRGHGRSTLGDEPLTVARLGDDLATVLEQLGLRNAVVAGHSMGGFGAMAFVCDHPDLLRDRVRGLMLVSTASHGVGLGALDPLATWVLSSGALSWIMRRPHLGLVLVRGTLGRRPVHAHLAATRDMFVATEGAVRAASFTGFGQMDHREGLAKVDVPTVVVVGSRDPITPLRQARAIAATIPDARLEVVDGAGHMLPLEAPDPLADLIAEISGRGSPVQT